jgi:hypothetical protein
VADPTRRVEILEGHRIRLARIEVLNCELRSPVALEQRREARPPRLPYLVAGLTSPEPDGSPSWTPIGSDADGELHLPIGYPFQFLSTHFLYGFTRVVNTCGAGFESTPWYTAHVIGPRVVGNPTPGQGQEGQFLIIDQIHIQKAERDRFTAFLVVAVVPLGDAHVIPAFLMMGGPGGGTPAATNTNCEQLDADSVSSPAEVAQWIQCSWQLSWMGVEQ